MIKKICIKKVLKYLSSEDSCESEKMSKFKTYLIKSKNILFNQLKISVLITFIITKGSNFLFIIQQNIEFRFVILIDIQIGWFYFNIVFLRIVENSLLQSGHENSASKCTLLPTISYSNKIYYTSVSSNCLTLDKIGCFEVYSNLNIVTKHLIH